MAQFGSLLGIFIASPLAARFGYQKATALMLVLSTLLVCIPIFAETVEVLMAGFLLQGVPWGVYQVISPAYASEVASLQLRPILTTWNNLCWVIGQLLASGVTKIFEGGKGDMSYRTPLTFHWFFCSALLIAVSFAPESPYWFLQKRRFDEARQAVRRLARKGSTDRAEEKLALMQHTIQQEASQDFLDAAASPGNPHGLRGWLGRLQLGCIKGINRRRTEISSIAWLIQATCGASLISWAPKLFEAAGLPTSDALSVNIALPAAGIIGTLASWWLMRRAGRRIIYLLGLITMTVLLAGCGGSHYMPKVGGWATGGILVVYTAVYDLTIGPVCYSIVSEIPSIRYRTVTLAIARGIYLLAGVANHVLTPKMLGTEETAWKWGARAAFLYAGCCLLGAIYTYYRLPETSGLSARELDILFRSKVSARRFSSAKASHLAAAETEKVLQGPDWNDQ